MAAVENNLTQCFEDVDVFTIPHSRMKHLLSRVSQRAHCTDFTSAVSFCSLLTELSSTFRELKQHEEIENKYIMKVLKRKLQGEALKKLLIHLHAHSHISDILSHVQKAEQKFKDGEFYDLESEGKILMKEMQDFFMEYLPHMTEEEQVLQPMLMQYLPVDKLRQIKDTVLQLHHLKGLEQKWVNVEFTFINQFQQLSVEKQSMPWFHEVENIDSAEGELTLPVIEHAKSDMEKLPEEILLHIFSFLGPKDLCRCASVNQEWNQIAYSGGLWHTLHLSRWGVGDWTFGKEMSSDDCNCDCEPNYDLFTFNDYSYGKNSDKSSDDSDKYSDGLGSLNSSDSEDSMEESVKREAQILNGVSRYLLSKVGDSVKTVVLECSKAITNGLLFRLLTKCTNLEYLDVSQTIISDFGLMGLVKVGCQKLQYLDVSGCKNITDKILIKLSSALGKKLTPTCDGQLLYEGRQLKTLRLSGCYKITDNGLRALAKCGGLPQLRHLDLSGCFHVSADGIRGLVSKSPKLPMDELFYCDNLSEEVSGEAGCCQNQGCLNRVCCRNQQEL